MNRQPPPLGLAAGLLLVAGFISLQACCERWLQRPLDHEVLSRQPRRLDSRPPPRQPASRDQHQPSAVLRPAAAVRYLPPIAARPGDGSGVGGGAAAALQQMPGSPRQEPAGSMGTGLLCARREGRRFRQMLPGKKIAAGVAKQGEDLLQWGTIRC